MTSSTAGADNRGPSAVLSRPATVWAGVSDDFLQIAHELALIATYVLNHHTRTLYMSREMAMLLRAGHEPMSMSIDEYRRRFYLPEHHDRVTQAADAAYSSGKPLDITAHARRADGVSVWLRTASLPRTNNLGEPVSVGLLQDVTAQYESDLALKANETRFRTLIENSPLAIAVLKDGIALFVNRKLRQLFGMAETQGVGASVEDFIAAEHRARVAQLIRDFAAGKPLPPVVETTALRTDGTKFLLHVDLEQVDVPEGRATLAFMADVTAQRTAEARIQYLNRLHAMQSATNEMIVRVSDVGQVLQKACDLAVEKGGFRMAWIGVVDEPTGKIKPVASAGTVDHYLDSVDIDLRSPTRKAGPSGRAVASGKTEISNDIANDPLMTPWRDRALKLGFLSSGAFPLHTGGTLRGVLSLYSPSVGGFDSAEVQLLEGVADDICFALDLADRAKERRELEEQLLQSQKMEAIGRLAGGVAHDFNNILAVILLQAELAERNAPADIREGLTGIRDAAQRAANLTRQLLLFSRRQVMQPKDIELSSAVRDLAKMLGRVMGEDIHLTLQPDPAPLWAHVDPGMLDQMVMNLALNARDAMPKGGTLILRTRHVVVNDQSPAELRVLNPGPYASISVIDSGTGIAPHILPHIFEPFFTTKDPGKGSGLGLATVFGVVKEHGGVITVQTAVGKGSEFQVVLPAIAPPKPVEEVPRVAKVQTGNETILFVEDDDSVRRVAREVLTRAGYRVVEAASGAAGLAEWQKSKDIVRLLITDIVMPGGMTGVELAKRLRDASSRIPVIFCTGYSEARAGQELEHIEGSKLIQKPFDSAALLDAVRQSLTEGAQHEQLIEGSGAASAAT